MCARLCTVELTRGVDFIFVCIYSVSHGLSRLVQLPIQLNTDMPSVLVVFCLKKSYSTFTDTSTLVWLECNSDQVTVGWVVCTVYTCVWDRFYTYNIH